MNGRTDGTNEGEEGGKTQGKGRRGGTGRGGKGREGTGRDETARDVTGRDGTGREGEEGGREREGRVGGRKCRWVGGWGGVACQMCSCFLCVLCVCVWGESLGEEGHRYRGQRHKQSCRCSLTFNVGKAPQVWFVGSQNKTHGGSPARAAKGIPQDDPLGIPRGDPRKGSPRLIPPGCCGAFSVILFNLLFGCFAVLICCVPPALGGSHAVRFLGAILCGGFLAWGGGRSWALVRAS